MYLFPCYNYLVYLKQADKNELREEKLVLKTDKERMEQQLKSMAGPPAGFMPAHPPVYPAAPNKMPMFPGYSLVPMWQYLPPSVRDTSQDHELRPPAAWFFASIDAPYKLDRAVKYGSASHACIYEIPANCFCLGLDIFLLWTNFEYWIIGKTSIQGKWIAFCSCSCWCCLIFIWEISQPSSLIRARLLDALLIGEPFE